MPEIGRELAHNINERQRKNKFDHWKTWEDVVSNHWPVGESKREVQGGCNCHGASCRFHGAMLMLGWLVVCRGVGVMAGCHGVGYYVGKKLKTVYKCYLGSMLAQFC